MKVVAAIPTAAKAKPISTAAGRASNASGRVARPSRIVTTTKPVA
jgi:hypothetical protein